MNKSGDLPQKDSSLINDCDEELIVPENLGEK